MERRSFLTVSGLAVASSAIPIGVAYARPRASRQLRSGAVHATLDQASYKPGALMKLTVRETLASPRKIRVHDSSGITWKRVHNGPNRAVFHAIAPKVALTSRVRVRVIRRSDKAESISHLRYTVTQPTGAYAGGARWAGHVPGQVVLGLSTPDLSSSLAAVGKIGLRRTFYQWSDPTREDKAIKEDFAAGRLPWISFKPEGGSSGWQAVAEGRFDADVRARARRYAAYSKPVIATFHHEPHNEGGDPLQWAAAYSHLYDVMDAETGLKNVTFAPIIGDWEFNPYNKDRRPEKFLTKAVIERIPFLGIDLYQNGSGDGFSNRLTRILDFLEYHGADDPMVGIGETGCCLAESDHPEEWLAANWDWASRNTDKIGAMSYFDSTRNSEDGHIWSLDETADKLATYRSLLSHSKAA
jgi:hypothetical protein